MNQRLFSSATSQSVAIVKFENIYDSKCSNKKTGLQFSTEKK